MGMGGVPVASAENLGRFILVTLLPNTSTSSPDSVTGAEGPSLPSSLSEPRAEPVESELDPASESELDPESLVHHNLVAAFGTGIAYRRYNYIT